MAARDRAIGIAERDRTTDAVATPRVFHEITEFERATPDIVFIEYALRQAAEETGHSVLEHASARREQRRVRRNHGSKLQQIVLVPASSVKEQERRCCSLLFGLEAIDEFLCHDAASSRRGSTPSISLRCGSRNFGNFNSRPSVSNGSSTAKPGMSVAISNRTPPGSRK
jgi:hypothetical protein